jgi:hypothetical protein
MVVAKAARRNPRMPPILVGSLRWYTKNIKIHRRFKIAWVHIPVPDTTQNSLPHPVLPIHRVVNLENMPEVLAQPLRG